MFAPASYPKNHTIAKYILGSLKLQVLCLGINADYNKTRRCGSVYLGVDVLSVREVCYENEGYVGSAMVLYI